MATPCVPETILRLQEEKEERLAFRLLGVALNRMQKKSAVCRREVKVISAHRSLLPPRGEGGIGGEFRCDRSSLSPARRRKRRTACRPLARRLCEIEICHTTSNGKRIRSWPKRRLYRHFFRGSYSMSISSFQHACSLDLEGEAACGRPAINLSFHYSLSRNKQHNVAY